MTTGDVGKVPTRTVRGTSTSTILNMKKYLYSHTLTVKLLLHPARHPRVDIGHKGQFQLVDEYIALLHHAVELVQLKR